MPDVEHTIALTTDQPEMPTFCCCCGGEATERHLPEQPGRMRGLPTPDEPISFPYCSVCLAHLKAAQNRKTSNLLALNLAIWGVGLPLAAGLPAASLVVGPGLGAYLFVRNKKAEGRSSDICTTDAAAARVVWQRGHEYRFTFTNKAFAEAFLSANRANVADR